MRLLLFKNRGLDAQMLQVNNPNNTHSPYCGARCVELQALRQVRPIYGADTGRVWSTSIVNKS